MAISRSSGILTISVDTRKVENMLNGYKRTIPRAGRKATKKIASMYASFYLRQMIRSKITPWTGHSHNLLNQQVGNPIRLSKDSYGVIVPQYLVMLDSMKPHWVSLKRGRSITKWAQQKLSLDARAIYFGLGKIFVRPHPWITSANIRAGKNVRLIAQHEIHNAIIAKGR